MTDLALQSIAELAPRIASRQVSPVDLTEAALARIAAENGRVNAFIAVLADEARAQALALDRELAAGGWRGPLHGIPLSLKDLIDQAGVPTTAASRVLEQFVPGADAPITLRLREAGAVFLGKCNLHEFAFGTTSEDSAYGPVRNPFDPTRSPGGSSGGSAAAVALGMGCASIGTDTGGSIRIPSSACGCVGLKPTFGEISCEGVIPLSQSLDHVGPLARSVADVALVYQAMRGTPDEALPDAPTMSALRLGVLRPYFMDLLEESVRNAVEVSIDRMARAGAMVVNRNVPHAHDIATIYLHIQLPEASAYHAAAIETMPDRYTHPVRLRLELGRYVQAEDYQRARRGARVLQREVDAALDGLDALVLPTLPISPPHIGGDTVLIDGQSTPVRAMMLRMTQLFDITGHPAISLPCGFTGNNLPVGLQLVGRRERTPELLAVATACERVLEERE